MNVRNNLQESVKRKYYFNIELKFFSDVGLKAYEETQSISLSADLMKIGCQIFLMNKVDLVIGPNIMF